MQLLFPPFLPGNPHKSLTPVKEPNPRDPPRPEGTIVTISISILYYYLDIHMYVYLCYVML